VKEFCKLVNTFDIVIASILKGVFKQGVVLSVCCVVHIHYCEVQVRVTGNRNMAVAVDAVVAFVFL